MAILCLTFWVLVKLFRTVHVKFYSSSNNIQGCLSFLNACYFPLKNCSCPCVWNSIDLVVSLYSKMTNDTEHFFLYLLAICISSKKHLGKSSVHFLSWVFVFLLLSSKGYVHTRMICKYLSILKFFFHFTDNVHLCIEVFSLSPVYLFLIYCSCFWCHI